MNFKLPEEVLEILEKFQKNGYQIFIVGGAVRDLLMGREVKDWDFTTDAKPEEILKLFPGGFYDNKFGTVGIPSKHLLHPGGGSKDSASEHPRGEILEITTMRKEGDYEDHRHPVEVSWTSKIEEDLARRDFTINAMALSLVIANPEGVKQSQNPDLEIAASPSAPRNDEYVLVDPFDGQTDLEHKLIRAVGDPEKRFKEDALRLIRAIRIASQLEFEIEEKTFKSVAQNAQLIKEIANERVRDELLKILSSMNPYMGINKLREAGILQIILPELERCFGIYQEGPKHAREYDIGEHSLLTLKETPSTDPLVRFAALLHDVGKPDTVKTDATGNVTFYNHDIVGGKIVLQIAKRFNMSKKQTDKLYKLVRWHMFSINENQTDSAIRRFIKNIGLENIDDMMDLRVGDRLGGGTQKAVSWRMEKFRERISQVLTKPFSVTDLKVTGNDVMEILNIPPSRKVGEILAKLFKEVLEDASKNNREYLLERIKQLS